MLLQLLIAAAAAAAAAAADLLLLLLLQLLVATLPLHGIAGSSYLHFSCRIYGHTTLSIKL
jgi:hypothetical protein